jgi:hypothetical protein
VPKPSSSSSSRSSSSSSSFASGHHVSRGPLGAQGSS